MSFGRRLSFPRCTIDSDKFFASTEYRRSISQECDSPPPVLRQSIPEEVFEQAVTNPDKFKTFNLEGISPQNIEILVDKDNQVVIRGEETVSVTDEQGVSKESKKIVKFSFSLPSGVSRYDVCSNFEDGELKISWS